MLYLLDANVLIDANMYYYPIEQVPEFWSWLAAMGRQGIVKVPLEIFEEVVSPRPNEPDAVIIWLLEHQDELLLADVPDKEQVARVIEEGYAEDLTDVEQEKIGRDHFLIAYARAGDDNRCVVSNEVSRPNRLGANRKIPDVCDGVGVRCINIFALIRELNFRTADW